jgi:hypothetical protein
MFMKYFIIRIIMLLSPVGTVASTDIPKKDTPKLTVWIRAGGNAVKLEISSFVEQILEKLPQNVNSKILVCTNADDTILDKLAILTKKYDKVKVIFSQLSSFSTALTTLAQNTDPESYVLSLSVGVDIRKDQIVTGLGNLTDRVRVYGWTVSGYGNDGSAPGRGWYNTAALIHKVVVKQMREEGVPSWVDNGVLGMIDKHIIGGNEEIPIMVRWLQSDPEAIFILNASDPVSSSIQLGTGISFQEKLERKIIVGKHYMQKLHQEYESKIEFESWHKLIWASLKVI